MSSLTWQEHFKDKIGELETPSEVSLLEHALIEGLLSEEEYFLWACKTHQIPLLQGNFFTEQEPDAALLEKVQLPWSSVLFPVAEWDGHVLIAGLEKPENLPAHCGFVYAPREGLAAWWERLRDSHVAPGGEAPEGIKDTQEAPSLDFTGISLHRAATAEAPKETNDGPRDEEPLEKTVVHPAATAKPVPQPVLETPLEPVTKKTSLPAATAGMTGSMAGLAPHQQGVFRLGPLEPKHALSTLMASNPIFRREVQSALQSLRHHTHTMLLALTEKNEALVPVLWSENFGQVTTPEKIHLGEPSAFNIMVTTEKPFHGAPVSNDINDRFMNQWHQGVPAETLTLVPLFFKNRLVGALLAIGPAAAYALPILRAAEKTSFDLTRRLGGAGEDSAAA
ncbi:MAG: hypothetical protein KF865_14475 [Bdellovibrionaceae bacterium]|nr:hypothetical protein [Pseudobdellovibrionaceae bacterium]